MRLGKMKPTSHARDGRPWLVFSLESGILGKVPSTIFFTTSLIRRKKVAGEVTTKKRVRNVMGPLVPPIKMTRLFLVLPSSCLSLVTVFGVLELTQCGR